jgi:hypothetical protein
MYACMYVSMYACICESVSMRSTLKENWKTHPRDRATTCPWTSLTMAVRRRQHAFMMNRTKFAVAVDVVVVGGGGCVGGWVGCVGG